MKICYPTLALVLPVVAEGLLPYINSSIIPLALFYITITLDCDTSCAPAPLFSMHYEYSQ